MKVQNLTAINWNIYTQTIKVYFQKFLKPFCIKNKMNLLRVCILVVGIVSINFIGGIIKLLFFSFFKNVILVSTNGSSLSAAERDTVLLTHNRRRSQLAKGDVLNDKQRTLLPGKNIYKLVGVKIIIKIVVFYSTTTTTKKKKKKRFSDTIWESRKLRNLRQALA